MEITHETWIGSGLPDYTPYTRGGNQCFERWVRSSDAAAVKLYAIHVTRWDFSIYANAPQQPIQWSAEVNFYREDGSWFTATLHTIVSSSAMEKFFSEIYLRMECVPDIHNQD